MTENTIATDVNLAVRQIKKLDARIAALVAEREGFADSLKALGDTLGSGKVVTVNGSFTLSEVNTYSTATMLANLAGGQANLCFKPKVLDPAKVKALYPAVYAGAKERKGWRVSVS